jgi:hypothetical protein
LSDRGDLENWFPRSFREPAPGDLILVYMDFDVPSSIYPAVVIRKSFSVPAMVLGGCRTHRFRETAEGKWLVILEPGGRLRDIWWSPISAYCYNRVFHRG